MQLSMMHAGILASRIPFLCVVAYCTLMVAYPTQTRADSDSLACEALLCLTAAASKRPSECSRSIHKFHKKLAKDPHKAHKWLRSCPTGDGGVHANFVMECTERRLFRNLHHWDDAAEESRVALDVPLHCKQFAQKINNELLATQARLPPELAKEIQPYDFLPVRSMRWVRVEIHDDEYGDWVDTTRYVAQHFWAYSDRVPEGFSVVYDPNTDTHLAPPPCPATRKRIGNFTLASPCVGM